ncbi:hypothetical protein S40285_00851 [Stachybotrys chlorohalonatus IBT 40285]|uniref:Uncharacterized protein n=1 Tax=Stachybotrys chlorohalonatus (strain IBT 40285) TaxID=1283841 RepID=A0A084QJM5_STAC4|nr:hypothetical protein S40285_00851 [Stachybotrys chlorohalonata IBT 40285]
MDDPAMAESLQHQLEPFIKPREQVNYIRRILALHLATISPGGSVKHSWALADGAQPVSDAIESTGYHKEYIDAVTSHISARTQFNNLSQSCNSPASAQPQTPGPTAVEDQISLLKLKDKHRRLVEVERHLNALLQQPASVPGFLSQEQLLQDVAPLPGVPGEVLQSLVVEQNNNQPALKERIRELERTVLRAKVLQRRQEQLLHAAKEMSRNRANKTTLPERLTALNATRNDLITWIEGELSKASLTEDTRRESNSQMNKLVDYQSTVSQHVAQVKEKYEKYVQRRRTILNLLKQRQPPTLTQPKLSPKADDLGGRSHTPLEFLLTPYVEMLLSNSSDLKAMITQKSHLNQSLAKQSTSTSQAIRYLAEESQLLPQYPLNKSSRRKSVIREELPTKSNSRLVLTEQVKPWVFAADAAKIATLETVAETVEGGQVALEGFMQNMHAIQILLGQRPNDATQSVDNKEATAEDVWLATSTEQNAKSRKHTGPSMETQHANDLWSRLHGSLGLIGHDD